MPWPPNRPPLVWIIPSAPPRRISTRAFSYKRLPNRETLKLQQPELRARGATNPSLHDAVETSGRREHRGVEVLSRYIIIDSDPILRSVYRNGGVRILKIVSV
jgi:hypothetical protein